MTSNKEKSMFSHSCTFKAWLSLEQRSPVWTETEPACDPPPAALSPSQMLGEVHLTCFATPDFPSDFISEYFPLKELHVSWYLHEENTAGWPCSASTLSENKGLSPVMRN